MTEKQFLKIIDDYYIKYGDEGELFSMHKPSDIRSLIYLINRENGFSELQCEYNDLDMHIHKDCENYSNKEDMCLKYFKPNISELKECQEKTVFNDKELSRKWSN